MIKTKIMIKRTLYSLPYAFCLFLIFNFTFLIEANATIRYVSHTGSSTPPYTTWETAADSIQKAIDICIDGDTVIVANGIYNESILIDKTINLWGNSADSTVINGTGTPNNYILYFRGTSSSPNNSSMRNFKLTSPGSPKTGLANFYSNLQAENCWISNVYAPVRAGNSSIKIEEFFVDNFDNNAIWDECPTDTCHGIYRSNIIIANSEASEDVVNFGFGGNPTIEDNTIILTENNGFILTGLDLEAFVNSVVKSNTVLGFGRQSIAETNIGTGSDTDTTFINNNISSYSFTGKGIWLYNGNKTKLRNNILSHNNDGIAVGFGPPPSSDYNIFWENNNDLVGLNYGDSDIVADPMFVKDTLPNAEFNFDYHLQKYSPAIDKGDPDILDVDGSRSDIGLFIGGTYKYLDLPPKTPKNFTYSFDSTNTILSLNWDIATEADFSHYNIYRDTISGFIPSQSNLIAITDTSYFADNLSTITSKNVYYRITAVDNQDNESQPGNEIAVTLVGVNPEVEIVRDYILYQNYPNPFNPSTSISYEIKERSYVKLMIYDIKGELISILVNKEQNAGYYEFEFGLKSQISNLKSDLASGIYLYRIEVIGKGNIPVYSDMKKMVLIK